MHAVRLISLACCLCLLLGPGFSKSASAQKGFYLRAGGGYLAPHASETNQGNISPFGGNSWLGGSWTNSGPNYIFETERTSLGAGTVAALTPGYMFSPNLGVEVGISAMVNPREYEYIFQGEFYGPPNGALLPYKTTIQTQAQNPVYLMPALVLSTGPKKLAAYARVGVAVPLNDKVETSETTQAYQQNGAPLTISRKSEFTMLKSLGLAGGIGVQFQLTNQIGIWLEASAISLNRYAKERELLEALENGVDYLPKLTTAERITEYLDEGNIRAISDPNQPFQAPTFSLPYSGAGGQAGLRFAFGK